MAADNIRGLESQQQRLHEKVKARWGNRDGGDGGGYDAGMEARLAKLEAAAEFVHRDLTEIKADLREVKRDARTDFRITWGAMIAGFVGLAGLLAKGFGWM